jgi:adenylate cyclase
MVGSGRTRLQLSGYRLQRIVRAVAAGFAIALCGLLFILTPLGTTLERTVGLDWLFKLRGVREPPADVTVVGINSRTGHALGLPRFPYDWPRTTHADLVDRLVQRSAGGIVFDIDFSRIKSVSEDSRFAQAIAAADRVVLFEWLGARRQRVGTSEGGEQGWIWIEQKQIPAPTLAQSAKALGPFPLPKIDQAAFEFWAFKPSAGDVATTAAVALQLKALALYDKWLLVLRKVKAANVDTLPQNAAQISSPADMQRLMTSLRHMFRQDPLLKQRVVQVIDQFYAGIGDDGRGLLEALAALYSGPDDYYINFYGPPGTIRTVPYEAIAGDHGSGRPDKTRDLENHMVFVGYSDLSDPDQPDRFYTSFTGSDGVDLSGVEIMATAYANLLTQRTLLPSSTALTSGVVLVFGLLVGVLAYALPATASVFLALLVSVLYAGFAQWRFNEADLWLPLATPTLVQLPMALLIGLMGQYLLERHKERRLTKAIQYYLPENIVRDLSESQVDPTTLNRVVFGTCLATDMSDFIGLAEAKPARELALFMNEYFDALAQALRRHGVDVMEFRADMIMCAWIAPNRSPAICRKGTHAALELSEIITQFAGQHGSRHFTPRVGLYDGEVYIGHTGGGGRFLYSIVGDAANTAARLESLNKHLGTHVLAAESVARHVDELLLRPLGSFRLKGKADPTSVCEILGRKETAPTKHQDLCVQFAEGLAAFQRKEWVYAAGLFESLTTSFVDDGPSRYYWMRCKKYVCEPPAENLAAVIQMDEK